MDPQGNGMRGTMKAPTEAQLMALETRLDRMQNESRAALGLVRKLLEYHKPNRQKTVLSFLDRPDWQKHQKDLRDGCTEKKNKKRSSSRKENP